MRGKGYDGRCRYRFGGITPAHAGKSPRAARRRASMADHPRACGEKGAGPVAILAGAGSPPRMRGKGIHSGQQGLGHRITPAHAGKSYTYLSSCCRSWGSPPRMRGKVHNAILTFHQGGITPAHAGKSLRLPNNHVRIRDHPRACGEKVVFLIDEIQIEGSPPRMRGKVFRTCQAEMSQRITPAHAGKSGRFERFERDFKDHPRACGEKASGRAGAV